MEFSHKLGFVIEMADSLMVLFEQVTEIQHIKSQQPIDIVQNIEIEIALDKIKVQIKRRAGQDIIVFEIDSKCNGCSAIAGMIAIRKIIKTFEQEADIFVMNNSNPNEYTYQKCGKEMTLSNGLFVIEYNNKPFKLLRGKKGHCKHPTYQRIYEIIEIISNCSVNYILVNKHTS